jgi:hypothetical protein
MTTITTQYGELTFDYTPGRPGRTYGPPEKCYEAEPAEVCLIKLEVDGEVIDPPEDIWEELETAAYEHIEKQERDYYRYDGD